MQNISPLIQAYSGYVFNKMFFGIFSDENNCYVVCSDCWDNPMFDICPRCQMCKKQGRHSLVPY